MLCCIDSGPLVTWETTDFVFNVDTPAAYFFNVENVVNWVISAAVYDD
jgi:hypothetical protein